MTNFKYTVFALITVLTVSAARSQNLVRIPYTCGFEDSVEVSKWVLNSGPQGAACAEKWIVGNGARSEGRSGLYISNDGYSAKYGKANNLTIAYREFTVPATNPLSQPYDISFDWRCTGTAGISEFYAFIADSTVIPAAYNYINSSSASASLPPSNISSWWLSIVNSPASNQWKNHSFTTSLRAGRKYRLMFVWRNQNTDTTLQNPVGACIDNIQIASTNSPKPDNLNITLSCDTSWLRWTGQAGKYEIQYKSKKNLRWNRHGIFNNNNGTNRTFITNLPEGMYDFRIRGIYPSDAASAQDTSAYFTKNSILLYCPENHCVDYTNLHSQYVTGYYGTFANPYANQGIIDNGADDATSRHTVNWIPDEYDPRTLNKLKKIPDNAIASVRLGNWEQPPNGKAEGLTYSFTVDSIQSIILLQYAIVLDDGHPDNPAIQPRFNLQILDQNNTLIDPSCGQANFYANQVGATWKKGENRVVWKDWTTIGLNLTGYEGKTLTIKLTTYDCGQTAHYGYAYFTLDCASATIKTNTCGESNVAKINAPDGFNYKWYQCDKPDSIIGTTKEIDIPATDTTVYCCRVSYQEDDSCYFDLSTVAIPRFPFAEFGYKLTTKNCQNILTFTNKSHVLTKSNNSIIHTTEKCETWFWDFGGRETSPVENPEFKIENTDTVRLNVTLQAFIADGECSEDTVIEIIIPPLIKTVDTLHVTMCESDLPYRFVILGSEYGIIYSSKDTVLAQTVKSRLTGCDSTIVLDLKVYPQYDTAVKDTICFGEKYYVGNHPFTDSQKDKDIWLTSKYGCDSVVTLNLTVLPQITFTATGTDVLNGPNSGKIEIDKPANYTYSVNGVPNMPLTGLSGGIYNVVVYNEHNCASDTQRIVIQQDCLEPVLENSDFTFCTDEQYFEIRYTINKGYATTYSVIFDKLARAAGFENLISMPVNNNAIRINLPDSLRPDTYALDVVFEDLLCGDSVHNSVKISAQYPSKIIKQKWNDVLAVMNEKYNGGYTFSAFQWYRDGKAITGETGSYLYIKDGNLDANSEYSVLLTRADDGKAAFTCTVTPEVRGETGLYPTFLAPSQMATLNITQSATVSVFNSMGIKIGETRINGGISKIFISDREGYYTVLVNGDDGSMQSFKVLVK